MAVEVEEVEVAVGVAARPLRRRLGAVRLRLPHELRELRRLLRHSFVAARRRDALAAAALGHDAAQPVAAAALGRPQPLEALDLDRRRRRAHPLPHLLRARAQLAPRLERRLALRGEREEVRWR